MTNPSSSALPTTLSDDSPAPALWIERVRSLRYVGYSERGGIVQIGGPTDDDTFTPGELLKIALAGCTGLSSDAAFARRLGDDYEARIHISAVQDTADNRYSSLVERLEVDLSQLDEAARERLLNVVSRAIDRNCTVSRTLKAGATVELSVATVASEPY